MSSDWTVDTLKEHVERIFLEHGKALENTLVAVKEAQAAALAAVKQENLKTEISAEKRFELLNELRSGVATKEQLEALEKVVEELKIYKAIAESKAESWLVWLGLFFTGASFFFGIISIAISVYVVFFQGK